MQPVVTLSTIKVELVASTERVKEALWLKGLIGELGILHERVIVFCGKEGIIKLTRNPMYHERSKHIDIRLYFI